MTEELTQQDKAKLLGVTDGKAVGSGNGYDQAFYEAMQQTPPLGVEEVDDLVRRAILRYIADTKKGSVKANGSYIMMGFVHGYMVGRKLRRDIRRK